MPQADRVARSVAVIANDSADVADLRSAVEAALREARTRAGDGKATAIARMRAEHASVQ
jgi:hypothetical protein